jgi:ribonuclease D
MDSIYSYLDNINVTVCPDNVDDWINSNIIQTHCTDVGFDTESKPLYGSIEGNNSHILAIIQISTPTNVLIYRVFNMLPEKWPLSLVQILENQCINKYCIDSRQDEMLLTNLGFNVKGFVDIQPAATTLITTSESTILNRGRIGMKELAFKLLGLKLDKTKNIQAGDWSRYPLSIKQIEYAATDAIVCLALAEYLQFTPKKLVRTVPRYITQFNGDKSIIIISFLISCITNRKKRIKYQTR